MSSTIESSWPGSATAGGALPCECAVPQTGNWLDRICRLAVQRHLEQLQGGHVYFRESDSSAVYGSETEDHLQSDLVVQDSGFFRQIIGKGSLGLADSYIDGLWRSQDLPVLLRILCRNMERLNPADRGIRRLPQALNRLMHRFNANSLHGSRRNIAAHYDLGNDFFRLFLDSSMAYSSAYFAEPDMDLAAASVAKFDRLCRKLDLNSDDRLMEIGTGWGGFAVHAARHYGCHVTSTTISDNQYEAAKSRVAADNLGNQVSLLKSDYRNLDGQYDKLVSIEMIEAVGERFLDTYFRKCNALLKNGGRLAIQAIVMPERRYAFYRNSVDFIQKYVFPGGFLPSIAAICESVGRTSKLSIETVEDLTPHYERTLAQWRSNFLSRLDEVKQLGYDDRFIRLWEYYLCYCEAAFAEGAVNVVQMVWNKNKS